MAALSFAEHIGYPVNVALTIHWSLAGGPGGGTWRERQSRLLERLRHWLDYRAGVPFVCIWTAEQSPHGKDAHTHFALHLPSRIDVAALRRYIGRQIAADDAKALDIQLCRDHPRGARGWLTYCTKAVAIFAPELVPRSLRQHHGLILGRRIGISHAIGLSARARHFSIAEPALVSGGKPPFRSDKKSKEINRACEVSQAI